MKMIAGSLSFIFSKKANELFEVIEKRQQYLQEMLVGFNEQEVAQLSSYLQKLHVHMKQD
ncbi:hypothetical protein LSPH24S_05900 [Lysinibacillus sphaericus]